MSLAKRYIYTIFVYTLPRLHTLNVNRSKERKWFYTKKKALKWWYPAETMTDADYADNLVLLLNTSTESEFLQHGLLQPVGGIGLYMNAIKQSICVLTKKGLSLRGKSVDQFIYISSTESDVTLCLMKVQSAIDRLSIIWKCDVFNNIKQDLVAVSILLYGGTT